MSNQCGKKYFYKGLFATLCAGLLIWHLTLYIADMVSAFNSKNWPSVKAKVIESNSITGCGKGSYYAKVKYQYVIEYNIYTSARIYFGSSPCGSQSTMTEITNKFKVGEIVTAHYNIMSPSESVLIAGTVFWDTWLGLIVMVVGLIFFIFTLVDCYRKSRSNRLQK